MVKSKQSALRSQAGFTLVELAIVMIIIGLLIGGVLKGQQLITNAQITATVAQVKSIDAATTSFKDMYNGMPGDILQPQQRLSNCTAAPCNVAGDGDNKVDNNAPGGVTFGAAPGAEQLAYWDQLNVAGLITGINRSAVPALSWGGEMPASKISGGGFDIGWNAGNCTLANQVGCVATNSQSGHYLALHGTPGGGVLAASPDAFMTPNNAARIDTKIDDGSPSTGVVLAAGAGGCVNGLLYNESVANASCSLYIKFQN